MYKRLIVILSLIMFLAGCDYENNQVEEEPGIYDMDDDDNSDDSIFDDEAESIRYFDIAKQTSIKMIDKVTILPATDILLSDKEKAEGSEKLYTALEEEQKIL